MSIETPAAISTLPLEVVKLAQTFHAQIQAASDDDLEVLRADKLALRDSIQMQLETENQAVQPRDAEWRKRALSSIRHNMRELHLIESEIKKRTKCTKGTGHAIQKERQRCLGIVRAWELAAEKHEFASVAKETLSEIKKQIESGETQSGVAEVS